jgi:hypothetical protein
MRLLRRSEPFDSDLYMYELKVDGCRALAHIEAGKGNWFPETNRIPRFRRACHLGCRTYRKTTTMAGLLELIQRYNSLSPFRKGIPIGSNIMPVTAYDSCRGPGKKVLDLNSPFRQSLPGLQVIDHLTAVTVVEARACEPL